jgi:hypothetical protein
VSVSKTIRPCLHLITGQSIFLISIEQVVFEDDQSQLIGEADLLNKILKIM